MDLYMKCLYVQIRHRFVGTHFYKQGPMSFWQARPKWRFLAKMHSTIFETKRGIKQVLIYSIC